MSDCGCEIEANDKAQRKVLRWLLAINALMFVVENVTGLLASSTSLLADSLDMLADAIVYGISLYAVGRGTAQKLRAAFLSGLFQMTLAALVLFDVVRRFISGESPDPVWMIGVGMIALVANLCCFALIDRQREGGIHMRASWIFSRNDVVANLSVILAGTLVWIFHSRLPDLVIGLAISLLVLWGGISIISETRKPLTKL